MPPHLKISERGSVLYGGGFAQVQDICLYHNFVFTSCTSAATWRTMPRWAPDGRYHSAMLFDILDYRNLLNLVNLWIIYLRISEKSSTFTASFDAKEVFMTALELYADIYRNLGIIAVWDRSSRLGDSCLRTLWRQITERDESREAYQAVIQFKRVTAFCMQIFLLFLWHLADFCYSIWRNFTTAFGGCVFFITLCMNPYNG